MAEVTTIPWSEGYDCYVALEDREGRMGNEISERGYPWGFV
jgi:hypothetical protein